jgi:hypothetical protein
MLMLNAHAQLHIGPKAGINFSKISGKEFTKEFNFNYLVGGFAEIDLGTVGLHPEVLFGQSTATKDDTYADLPGLYNTDQLQAQYNFLSIPILLNAKLTDFIHIEAGPQYSILLDRDKSLLNNGKEAFKSGEFALAAGLQLKIGKVRLWGRYLVGLNGINDVSAQEKWKSQSIQVALGYSF